MESPQAERPGSSEAPALPAPSGSAPSRRPLWALGAAWTVSRTLLVLVVSGVLRIANTDVTADVSVIYHSWYEVLCTGTFPLDDVTWQYPPGAALVILLPGLLPWSYLVSFFVICAVVDAAAMALLMRAGVRKGRSYLGAWYWVVGVPLLGPTVYCRYDIIVTALAVAGLLVVLRRPAVGGMLLGLGGLLKIWPLLALFGTPRGRRTRRSWTSAATCAAALGFLLTAGMNGAFEFLKFQSERGIEIESLGALPLHFAKLAGSWHGTVTMNYGSVEFLGPWVPVISKVMVGMTVAGFGWLLIWRLRAARWTSATTFDAALCALLIFTATSRVISPQYMIWVVGLAAVCLTVRGSSQRPVAVLVLVATVLTTLEFPVMFGSVNRSELAGVLVLTARNLVLLVTTVLSAYRLWRSTRRREALTTVVLPAGQVVSQYPVRPGIAYEQDLLDDLTPADRT
ncbi:glycosyltransferase 87 family protein [Kitasatospora griseola]|uniref:glycosyltransferase 87 family protein n=1 Tax=Kitasatospora griseola TaxID=2064 RepID=UPI00167049CA|nr:glycosyltransferase 87 family protein [Kitasatospora griseola]GGQ49673.1 membrane protein [Kitasatospora griseola]